MLNEKIVSVKLRELAINCGVELKTEYMQLVEKHLNEEGFTDAEFVRAVDTIIKTSTNAFGRMPTVAMFLKAGGRTTEKLTLQDENQLLVSELMGWLAKQSYESVHGEEVWSHADYDKVFESERINVLIQAEFGSVRGLIEEYKQKKQAGSVDWFRKELREMFATQDLKAQKQRIENSKREEIGGVVENLSKKLRIVGNGKNI